MKAQLWPFIKRLGEIRSHGLPGRHDNEEAIGEETMTGYITLAFMLGVFTWSLAEYCIHRWLGHNKKLIKNPFGAEHTAHHSKGNYFSPSWKKLLAALGVVALTIAPAILIAGPVYGSAWVLGFVSFYLYYEMFHRLEHISEGSWFYTRWVRRHHFHHHFHNPRVNHGVTSPLWDFVFGTFEASGQILVPVKLKMVWLTDPETGEVWDHLKSDYQLRHPKRRVRK